MKIQAFRRIQRADFPDAPEWFHRAADVNNKQFELITNAVSGRLNAGENINADIKKGVTVQDGEEFELAVSVDGKPADVRLIWSEFYEFHRLKWRIVDLEHVAVTIRWDTAPSSPPKCNIRVDGGG